MAYELSNEDLKVSFTKTSGPGDRIYAGDQSLDAIKIVAQKSTKAKMNSKFVCKMRINLTFSAGQPCPFTSATYTFVSGSGTINTGKITKDKTETNIVLSEEDSGTCTGSWTLTAIPHTALACGCDVKISDAGQTKVKGE